MEAKRSSATSTHRVAHRWLNAFSRSREMAKRRDGELRRGPSCLRCLRLCCLGRRTNETFAVGSGCDTNRQFHDGARSFREPACRRVVVVERDEEGKRARTGHERAADRTLKLIAPGDGVARKARNKNIRLTRARKWTRPLGKLQRCCCIPEN